MKRRWPGIAARVALFLVGWAAWGYWALVFLDMFTDHFDENWLALCLLYPVVFSLTLVGYRAIRDRGRDRPSPPTPRSGRS